MPVMQAFESKSFLGEGLRLKQASQETEKQIKMLIFPNLFKMKGEVKCYSKRNLLLVCYR